MNIKKEYLPYISGEKFLNSIAFRLPQKKTQIPKRIEQILQLCEDKRVVHLGCCDHVPLIEQKINSNRWLHDLLTKNSKECIGIDIDLDAISFIEKQFKITNVFHADITKELPEEVNKSNWDFLVLGEILEHIDNPVDFLSKIKKNCPNIKNIIISVPNAQSLTFAEGIKQNIEYINTDHRYWFTPYTLIKVMHQSKITLDKLLFVDRKPLTKWGLVKRKIYQLINRSEPKYNVNHAKTLLSVGQLN